MRRRVTKVGRTDPPSEDDHWRRPRHGHRMTRLADAVLGALIFLVGLGLLVRWWYIGLPLLAALAVAAAWRHLGARRRRGR